MRICYHDPCYLGRHNQEYFSARSVLSRLPGVELVEMDRNMKNALCCGGGGANFFTDILGSGKDAPANARVQEAAGTGARIIAVSCPLCANMLEDAIRVENMESRIQVREISEVVLERLG
ncbi:MAG: (Fe-S)-binding protein [Deltaproteobacteria bacterium]|nr:MAG: (Fe-S)-binding protein [Deltaproteobacteria bacterium]